jgi:hypothetical protein
MPQGLVWSAHWNRPIRRLLAELRLPRGRRSGSEWPTLVRAFEGAFDPERTYENPKSGCPKIGGDGFAPPHKYKRHAHAVACQELRRCSLPGYRPPHQIGDPAMQAPIGLRCVRGAVRTGANIAAAVIATS